MQTNTKFVKILKNGHIGSWEALKLYHCFTIT